MNSKYLPSKQFVIRLAIIIIIALVAWGIYFAYKLIFKKETVHFMGPTQVVVKDLIQKDSNDNGIADWEEGLWGLDPTKNGPENKDFILAKRAELAKDNPTKDTSNAPLTENDILSREFFATVLALQQNGTLNSDSMDSIAQNIGQKVVPEDIPNRYTIEMINPTGTAVEYITAFKKLVDKYADKDIGNELVFISQGSENRDPQALAAASSVAASYRAFGEELIKIPTPKSIVLTNLSLANNYEKVAISIEGLVKVSTDPIIAMRSLINYNKYSDALVSDVNKLSDSFSSQ